MIDYKKKYLKYKSKYLKQKQKKTQDEPDNLQEGGTFMDQFKSFLEIASDINATQNTSLEYYKNQLIFLEEDIIKTREKIKESKKLLSENIKIKSEIEYIDSKLSEEQKKEKKIYEKKLEISNNIIEHLYADIELLKNKLMNDSNRLDRYKKFIEERMQKRNLGEEEPECDKKADEKGFYEIDLDSDWEKVKGPLKK